MPNETDPEQKVQMVQNDKAQKISQKIGFPVRIEKVGILKPGEVSKVPNIMEIENDGNKETLVINEEIVPKIHVKDICKRLNMSLLEIKIPFTSSNCFKSDKLLLLIGKEENNLFMTRIEEPIKTIDQALKLLEPVSVRIAREKGIEVKRQGDWYFMPVKRIDGSLKVFKNLHLAGEHIAAEGIILLVKNSKRLYVRGSIRHSQHSTLELPNWHRAIQNQTRLYKRATKMVAKKIELKLYLE